MSGFGRGRGKIKPKTEVLPPPPEPEEGPTSSIGQSGDGFSISPADAGSFEIVPNQFEDAERNVQNLQIGAQHSPHGSTGGGSTIAASIRSGSTVYVTRNENYVKRGVAGRQLRVVTNYLPMDTGRGENCQFFMNRVEIVPAEDNTVFRKKIMNSVVSEIGQFTFDGTLLYTNCRIPDDKKKLIGTLSIAGSEDKKFDILIKEVREVELDDSAVQQFYNLCFKKVLQHMKLDRLGRNYFDSANSVKIPDYKIQVWRGYATAIRNHESGQLLCVELISKVIRTDSVFDLIQSIKHQNKNKPPATVVAAIEKEIVGQIVLTHYNKRTYRVDSIQWTGTPECTFNTKGSNGENVQTTYSNYYKSRYGIEIKEPNQPLLVALPKKKDLNKGWDTNIILIPTLCNLTGLSDDMRKNFSLMTKLSAVTHKSPDARVTALEKFTTDIKENEKAQQEFRDWGINFNETYLRAMARVLPKQKVVLLNANNKPTAMPYRVDADWTSELKQQKMLSSMNINKWIMFHPEPSSDQEEQDLEALIDEMKFQGRKLGMTVGNCKRFAYNRRSVEDLEKVLNSTMSSMPEHLKIDLAVCVLPDNGLLRYSTFKKVMTLKYNVTTQGFLSKHFQKKQNFASVIQKIMIQVNAKLGGEPWGVELPPKFKKAMIFGFDVYHCAERKNVSVGALVATMNRHFTQYFTKVSFHQNQSELAQNMCGDVRACLFEYKKINEEFPDTVIWYRDGVGDGQIVYVLDHEVRQIQKAFKEIYTDHGLPEPKFLAIIVTKRINTRFLTETATHHLNPPPGTVLDTVVTIPERFDFFLISQTARQGCVSPTSYNVILDTLSAPPDLIQELTYKMCHLYFNWSGTVSVPAPCQFAHKLAYLTGQSLGKEAPEALSNNLWFL